MGSPSDVEAAVVDRWREAGPRLEAMRRRELRELSDEEALVAARDLLDLLGHMPPSDEPTSGLVEQQRLFRRWRA